MDIIQALAGLRWGKVVVTSREQHLQNYLPGTTERLGPLSAHYATKLLMQTMHTSAAKASQDNAERLAERCGRSPVALAQAGDYIAHQDISIASYLDRMGGPCGSVKHQLTGRSASFASSMENVPRGNKSQQ